MLFYTATIIISLLIAVPIILMIYETDSLTNKENSESSFDGPITATGSTSGKKYRVKPVKLDYAKSTSRRKQLTDAPIRSEQPASVYTPLKIVANEEPDVVTELPNIMSVESVCRPFNGKKSANSC